MTQPVKNFIRNIGDKDENCSINLFIVRLISSASSLILKSWENKKLTEDKKAE